MDAVLNWIWQGSVIALATWIALAIIERSRARDRYLLVWTALMCVLALPVIPYVGAALPLSATAPVHVIVAAPLLTMPNVWWTSDTTMMALWTLWCAIAAARLGTAVVSLRRVKRGATRLPDAHHARLAHWSSVMTRGRRAALLVSNGVRSAAVLGCGAPAIVVTPALLDQLTDDELDRIVIHEWAHVQRRDDVMHLLQAGIMAIAGWHPAVWWLSRQLRIEREIACDEIAVAVTGSAKRYAASLVRLAQLPAIQVLQREMLTAIDTFGLRRRVVRILSVDPRASRRGWGAAAAAAAGAVICVVASAVGGIEVIEAAVISESPALEAAQPTRVASVVEDARTATGVDGAVQPAAPARPAPSRQLPARTIPRLEPPATPAAAATTTAAPVADIDGSPVSGAFGASAPARLTPRPTAVSIPVPLWRPAADSGAAIGRESRDAAVATAGYFTRLGKQIAGSF